MSHGSDHQILFSSKNIILNIKTITSRWVTPDEGIVLLELMERYSATSHPKATGEGSCCTRLSLPPVGERRSFLSTWFHRKCPRVTFQLWTEWEVLSVTAQTADWRSAGGVHHWAPFIRRRLISRRKIADNAWLWPASRLLIAADCGAPFDC